MRCHKPGTDQQAEFTVFANGVPCDEYAILPSAGAEPNTLKCIVPVTEGDHITIHGNFTGSVLHAAFDILADESFVADRRLEGARTGESKLYTNRKFGFNTVHDVPSADTVVEGKLYVKRIGDVDNVGSSHRPESSKIGFGSIAVIVCLTQNSDESHTHGYSSMTCGAQSAHDHKRLTDAGIRATYQLEVQATDSDLKTRAQQKHKRHYRQTRFGSEPWSRFIFYLRSKQAIEEAGCERMVKMSHSLTAAIAGSFVQASPVETKEPGAKRPIEDQDVQENDDGDAVVSHPTRANSMFVTPNPEERTERVGLNATSTVSRLHKKRAPELSKTPHEPSPSNAQKKQLFGQALPPSVKTSSIAQQASTTAAGGDLALLMTEHQNESETAATSTAIHRTRNSEQREAGQQDAEKFLSDSIKHASQRPLAQNEPSANQSSFDEQQDMVMATSKPSKASSESLELKQEPIEQDDDTIETLDNSRDARMQDHSSGYVPFRVPVAKMSALTEPAARSASASSEPRPTVERDTNKVESLEKLCAILQDDSTIASNSLGRPLAPSTYSNKRSSSSTVTSRDNTPNKRPRFPELSAKKAEMLKQLQLKQQRVHAAERALEEQRKVRDEARKQQEAEIEALERRLVEEDEKYERLMHAKHLEEEEWQEAMQDVDVDEAEGL